MPGSSPAAVTITPVTSSAVIAARSGSKARTVTASVSDEHLADPAGRRGQDVDPERVGERGGVRDRLGRVGREVHLDELDRRGRT